MVGCLCLINTLNHMVHFWLCHTPHCAEGHLAGKATWQGRPLGREGHLAGKATWALSGCLTTESADYCMLINEWAGLRLQVCLLRLEVDLGSVLESELGQKWRYGAIKTCVLAKTTLK